MIKLSIRIFLACLFLGSTFTVILANDVATKRAAKLEVGMNVSYLDQYWRGKKQNQFSDFANYPELLKRKHYFKEIRKAGFKTVRIPINFSAWATIDEPYRWRDYEDLLLADKFIDWALEAELNVVIDLHHTEFDGSIENAATTPRMVWLWSQISKRYKKLDPEKVLFEIRNEPHDIEAKVWRKQAEAIIATIRNITKEHTLVVGFHDWNSRASLVSSKPFKDKNIIYTFHYYDPFVFTHQGATWSGEGLKNVKSIPFPYSKSMNSKPPKGAGTWVKGMLKNYRRDSDAKKMYADLKEAKDWSVRHKVPIFMGEFGSYNKFTTLADRCRHAAVIYQAAGKLKIPNAWWEWDGGFNMFADTPGKRAQCMTDAINLYNAS